jgi:hypothetical protein
VIKDYEDVTAYTLDRGEEESLLATQNECTFIWSNKEGWPVGVIMSFVFVDGRFWLTSSGQRKRVAAVQRDNRVAVVVTSKGTELGANRTVTYKGRCAVHRDDNTKAWFYLVLAKALHADDHAAAERFISLLDSPRRVVLEVVPNERIGFDGTKMRKATALSCL